MNRRGVALIASYMVIIAVLTILGIGLITRSVSEGNIARRYANSVKAFWASEAGIARALSELRANFGASGNGLWSGNLVQGCYEVDVENETINGQMYKKVTVRGFAPATSSEPRIIEAMMSKYIPPEFYDNAVYSAGDIDLNGNSYSIDGNVLYADTIENTDNITGTITYDPQASPLARLDFQQLYTISEGQDNIYDEARLDDVKKGEDSFPDSFWYSEPTDPNDPTTGTPNVVYVESDLELNGNIGTIGGFFVVAGDVITNPDDTSDATINGNGEIDGVVYTLGEFRINGGGGGLNVNGGVWAGEEARLNGNAHIAYSEDYMSALEALDINAEVQIASWRDTQNPYKISP